MKRISIRLTLLFLVALLIIACTSNQEKIDRAVQMTVEAQQTKSVQQIEKTTDNTKVQNSAENESQQSTATPIISTPEATNEITDELPQEGLSKRLVGLWAYSSEQDGNGWVEFENNGVAWLSGHFQMEYEIVDERSVLLSAAPNQSINDRWSLGAYMVDDNTLILRFNEGEAIESHRQSEIENLPDKLIGYWQGEFGIFLFLPNNRLVVYGTIFSYKTETNLILVDANGLDPLLVLSIDEQELVLADGSTLQRATRVDAFSSPGSGEILFPYQDYGTNKCGYIDRSGNIVIESIFAECSSFNDGLAVVIIQGNLGGYIDTSGVFVIEPRFVFPQMFSEGLARVRDENGLAGYIDLKGEFIISPQFHNAGSFSNGLAEVETESGRFFIDKAGNIVRTLAEGESYYYSEGLAAVEDADGCSYINTDGQVEIQTQYYYCSEFNEGLAAVEDAGGCSYINTDGQVEIQTPYIGCLKFSERLAAVYDYGGYRCGYIDTRGRLVIDFKYTQCHPFSEDRAVVQPADGYFAYIDERGRYVFNPTNMGEHGYAYEFRNGLASFVVGGQTGYIDRNGIIVHQPETWSDTLTVDPENLSVLAPNEYMSMTTGETEYTITRYLRQIVGSKIVWSGTILTVDANGRITVNVDASIYGKTQTFQIFLDDVDQAMLSRLRNNNPITFRAIIADFDRWSSQQVPKIYADKAVILSIGN